MNDLAMLITLSALPKDKINGEIPVGTHVMYHPQEGEPYEVEITDSHFWGMHGLSNFFHWNRVSDNKKEHGYGNFSTLKA